ncbi:MAG: ArsA-related P-loop ATPase, partial [Solirubrobacteraceae bacterium]
MDSLLDRRLIVVTGKGGTGKTTIAGAIGLLAARRGIETVVLDAVGDGRRLQRIFAGAQRPERGAQNGDESSAGDGDLDDVELQGSRVRLAERLHSLSIEPDAALEEWMRGFAGRLPTRMLASRSSFQYFAAAAPGARELVCMAKVASLANGQDQIPCELVVLDAPASGHALGLLQSPQTFATIARVGPLAGEADAIRALLSDRGRTGILAVAAASEMAVTETIELEQQLEQIGLRLDSVIVNAVLKRRFSSRELELIATAAANGAPAAARPLVHAAAAAARTAHERGRLQHNQLARLRRHDLNALQVPFVFERDLNLAALERIAD